MINYGSLLDVSLSNVIYTEVSLLYKYLFEEAVLKLCGCQSAHCSVYAPCDGKTGIESQGWKVISVNRGKERFTEQIDDYAFLSIL